MATDFSGFAFFVAPGGPGRSGPGGRPAARSGAAWAPPARPASAPPESFPGPGTPTPRWDYGTPVIFQRGTHTHVGSMAVSRAYLPPTAQEQFRTIPAPATTKVRFAVCCPSASAGAYIPGAPVRSSRRLNEAPVSGTRPRLSSAAGGHDAPEQGALGPLPEQGASSEQGARPSRGEPGPEVGPERTPRQGNPSPGLQAASLARTRPHSFPGHGRPPP